MKHKTTYVPAFIGLGSNQGNREANITAALSWLADHPDIELQSNTPCIETEPWGYLNQPSFFNAVARIVTGLRPHSLLREMKRGEKKLGRIYRGVRWGPREIDLDILLYGNEIVNTPILTIPHAELTERPFVLKQLIELDQSLIHPKSGVLLKRLLTHNN